MTNKIIVRNTSILIADYSLGDYPKIENNFKLYDKLTHKIYYLGMHYDEEERILYLPRGIDIWYIEQIIGQKAYIDKNYNKYEYIDIKLKVGPRDEKQKEALRFLVGAAEYKDNEYKSQLCLNLNTGAGKTYTSIAAKVYFQMKSILITYSINWLDQWKACMIQYTSVEPSEVLIIEGSPVINRLLKMKPEQLAKYKMYLVTHATIKSYANKHGWKAIGKLFEHLKVGIKLVDEAHLNFENMTMIDFHTNVYKTYYITATPARSSEEENIIYGRYFKNIPSIDLFDEEEDPHTKYIAIKFKSKPTPFEITACKNQYGLDRNKYCNYLTGKEEFYKLLTVVMDLCLKVNGKCLIYIGTNYAIGIIYRWLSIHYPELYNNIGIFTTLTAPEFKEEQKEKKIILSTTKSCGAAMDIKGLKMTVNLAEPFKSEVLAVQTLGRTRDEDTFYIDIVDMSFIQCRKYYYYKKPIFERRAVSCTEISIDENELTMRNMNIRKERIARLCKPMVSFQMVAFAGPVPKHVEIKPISIPMVRFY